MFEIRTETQHHLSIRICKTAHHFSDPSIRFRTAVGIRQQDIIIMRCLDSDCQGQFLTTYHTCSLRNKRMIEFCTLTSILLQYHTRLIFASIIHNDYFILWIILCQKIMQIILQIFFFIASANYHTHPRQLCRFSQRSHLRTRAQIAKEKIQLIYQYNQQQDCQHALPQVIRNIREDFLDRQSREHRLLFLQNLLQFLA